MCEQLASWNQSLIRMAALSKLIFCTFAQRNDITNRSFILFPAYLIGCKKLLRFSVMRQETATDVSVIRSNSHLRRYITEWLYCGIGRLSMTIMGATSNRFRSRGIRMGVEITWWSETAMWRASTRTRVCEDRVSGIVYNEFLLTENSYVTMVSHVTASW